MRQVKESKEDRCEWCNCHLKDELNPAEMAHIKGKGAHPSERLNPENIRRLCFECHDTETRMPWKMEARMNLYKENLFNDEHY